MTPKRIPILNKRRLYSFQDSPPPPNWRCALPGICICIFFSYQPILWPGSSQDNCCCSNRQVRCVPFLILLNALSKIRCVNYVRSLHRFKWSETRLCPRQGCLLLPRPFIQANICIHLPFSNGLKGPVRVCVKHRRVIFWSLCVDTYYRPVIRIPLGDQVTMSLGFLVAADRTGACWKSS